MCGIVGFVDVTDARIDETLRGMLAEIAHRGPDDVGLWRHERVGLGHARLSIIDLTDRGHQPFVTDDGLGALVFNGEIYNYRELRESLKQEGVTFRSETDTEVALYALHKWGPEQAVPMFNGMFALAYYDLRDESLWLTRDRLGIKPLFTARTPRGLVFASEQKALFKHPAIQCALDEHSLLCLLLYERFDGAMTAYRGVEAFLPGTIYRFRGGSASRTTYFDVLREVAPARIAEHAKQSFASQLERFERYLRDSVEMHLVSDAPVATMCSGGLDSGLVTAMAAQFSSGLVSYVADIEGMNGEELARARTVAESLRVELRSVPVDHETYFRTLPEAIAANDQPLFFSQHVASMVVAKALRNDGFKVVLTGDGADELFGGYPWHVQAHREWRRLAVRAKWIPDIWLTRTIGTRVPGLRPVSIADETARYLTSGQPLNYVSDTLNVLFVAGAPRTLRQRRLFSKLAELAPEDRAFLASSFEDIYVHMRECLSSVDKMTMRHSMEARVPFLENRLIEFGMELPVSAKLEGGVAKRIIKALARKLLPESIVGLPKIGFRMPPAAWANAGEFLRDGRVAGLLKWPAADQTEILELLKKRPYYQFRLLACEIWLRMRFDGEAPGLIAERLTPFARASA